MEMKRETERLCMLLVDEMQLKTRVEFDNALRRVVGYVSPETLPDESAPEADKELATHAMVYMLRGLTSSWKQSIAYLFTGKSLKREPFWMFTKQVIEESEAAGFKIQGVVSDMGSTNTGLWNLVGIESNRTKISPSITHPCCNDRALYFIADPLDVA